MMRIDRMYAFVVVDKDGTEGVAGMRTDDGWLPLVGADFDRVDSLRPIAQHMADTFGHSITLVEFSTRRELEVIVSGKEPSS